jgi:Ca-activated chloride channel family protein
MATKAAADRITINTIGIGVDWSDDLLDEVSRISGGNTVYMDSPSTLGDLTKQIMNSLRHVAAVQVQVDAKIAKNINLRSSYRIHPDPLPLNNTFPMLLGHLPSNGKISVLMEWLLDPIGESGIMTLAEFQVSSGAMPAEMSNSPLIATSRIPVSDQEDPSPPPSEILSAVSAMTLYRLQERARQEVKTGHVQDAVQRLERIASHLFRMGEQTLANIALSEARTLKQSHRFSERGEKALKYGSRALLQSPPREKP